MFGSAAAEALDVKLVISLVASLFVAAGPARGAEQPAGNLVMLHKADIRSSIVGKWLMPDRKVKQAALEFGEIFVADGTWRSSRQQRALLMLEGYWTIKGDSLCVQITKASWGSVDDIHCRTVWRNAANGNIAMADIGAGDAGAAIVELSTRPIEPGDRLEGARRRSFRHE